MPKPTDNEKNAWPKAALQINGLESTEKSGVKKKSSPSPKPDNVVQKSAKIINRRNENGMSMVEIRCMPFFTPNDITTPVMIVTITK